MLFLLMIYYISYIFCILYFAFYILHFTVLNPSRVPRDFQAFLYNVLYLILPFHLPYRLYKRAYGILSRLPWPRNILRQNSCRFREWLQEDILRQAVRQNRIQFLYLQLRLMPLYILLQQQAHFQA